MYAIALITDLCRPPVASADKLLSLWGTSETNLPESWTSFVAIVFQVLRNIHGNQTKYVSGRQVTVLSTFLTNPSDELSQSTPIAECLTIGYWSQVSA